ncbi:hypothetical protein B0J18DRAFT_468096 [Chaetomium sp. MPI-SDFR-AT-0129]|nr:hypothetical protein B0J18DRAFT_468096 [Chaetomium sp. MPI-SDFR-AT-0129]
MSFLSAPLANTRPGSSHSSASRITPSPTARFNRVTLRHKSHTSSQMQQNKESKDATVSTTATTTDAAPTKRKKSVRFVKGHVTIPDDPAEAAKTRPKGGHLRISVGQRGQADGEDEEQEEEDDSDSDVLVPGEEEDDEEVEDDGESTSLPTRLSDKPDTPRTPHSPLPFSLRNRKGGIGHRRFFPPAGVDTTSTTSSNSPPSSPTSSTASAVRESAPREGKSTPWRKTPRFRGSGFIQVLDDPIPAGLALARTAATKPGEIRLPSDAWRVPVKHTQGMGVSVGSRVMVLRREAAFSYTEEEEEWLFGGLGKGGKLRYEEGEREAGFSLGDVDVEQVVGGKVERGYVVKVVDSAALRGGNKNNKQAAEGRVGSIKTEGETETGSSSVEQSEGTTRSRSSSRSSSVSDTDSAPALSSTTSSETASVASDFSDLSDFELGDDEGYDFVNDFSLEEFEADGWVPVMIAEDRKAGDSDDWMSLTGSWMKLGEVGGVGR